MVTLVIDVDIIQDVETFLRNLNGRELLSYAICNEECGAETYEWLAERVGGSVAEEFKRLAAEKRKHALRMRELFERAYPGMKPTKFNAPPWMPCPSAGRCSRWRTSRRPSPWPSSPRR
ncbi:ferritin family protein [Thermococcus sp.]|uniref:ferritin family protein n=1 Tax=Thermococcus sp. TaxID=35749 RepID=UPI002623124D|nr:ferritin family protein [Thermococcus sp.]